MALRSKVDNPDFIALALYRLGGIGRFIDVEDIFVECWKLAPQRFGWRTHEFPNYKTTSKALRDFESKHPDLLVKTGDGLSRQLTATGTEWIKKRLGVFSAIIESPEVNPPSRRPTQRLLNEIRDHPLFEAFLQGNLEKPKKFQIADLLMCSPDSPSAVWKERLATFRAAAVEAKRQSIKDFLDRIEQMSPEWFD